MGHKILRIHGKRINRVFHLTKGIIKTKVIYGSNMNTITFFQETKEFEIVFQKNDELYQISIYDCVFEDYGINRVDESLLLFIKLKVKNHPIEVILNYFLDDKTAVLRKFLKIRNTNTIPINILEIAVESLSISTIFERGGIGQPIFTPGFFFAIEWPYAKNLYNGADLELWHFPDVIINKGEVFKSMEAIIGATKEGKEQQGFQKYLEKMARRKFNSLMNVYCDWGAHDELGGGKELTEEMALGFSEILGRWKKTGISYDYYILDYQWFEKTQENIYLEWKKKNWPNGPERFFTSLKENDIKVGLWFDLSGFMSLGVKFPGVIDDALEQVFRIYGGAKKAVNQKWLLTIGRKILRLIGKRKGIIPCLISGDYAEKLENAILYYVKKWDLSLIKLDFTRFRCNNPHHNHKAGKYAEEKSLQRFLDILSRAREQNPQLKVMAYNGFFDHQSYIEQPTYTRNDYALSPFWCRWFETIYCGDPRLSEVPTPNERSSIACYTDTQIRLFRYSLLPWRTIDDSGVIIGNTDPILNLGKKDWCDAFIIGALGRGILNPMIYGDLKLIDNQEDRNFLRECVRFLEENTEICANPRNIGGFPDVGEIYGYILGEQSLGVHYIVLHNPSFLTRNYLLPNFQGNIIRLYPEERLEGKREISLRPAEIALFQLGGKDPNYIFEKDLAFNDGKELKVLREIYIRRGNKRKIGGMIILPPKIKNTDILFVVVSFKQGIYSWRELTHIGKNLKFKIWNNKNDLKYSYYPKGNIIMGSSWASYQVKLHKKIDNKAISFEITHPWERALRSNLSAFLLTKGNRKN